MSELHRLPAAVMGSHRAIGAVGTVSLWGRVIEHAAGWRGQLAYPGRIRIVCARCLFSGRASVPTRIEDDGRGRLLPLCDGHATPGRTTRRRLVPEEVQQRLLSTYAIDQMPVETLHRAGFRDEATPPARFVEAARVETRRITRGRSGMMTIALLILAFFIVRSLGLFSAPGGVDRASPKEKASVAAGEPSLVGSPAPIHLEESSGRRDRAPTAGVICGARAGNRVEVESCRRGNGTLLGWYTAPPEPRHACHPGHAYSRRPNFSVCWLDFAAEPGGPLAVLRMPTVHRWELAY